MENRFKDTYSRISIDEDRRALMEDVIRRKKGGNMAVRSGLIVVTAALATLMIIPATRTRMVNAAADLISLISASGREVTVERHSNETIVSVDYTDNNKSYTAVENGRLYLTVGDVKKDVTDKCSMTDYYRYETLNADGSKSVILVGGTVDKHGWIELIFSAKGKYITNVMDVPVDPDDPSAKDPKSWFNISMHNEGVCCGVPELDDKL